MKILRNNIELEVYLTNFKLNNPGKTVGFVPTMGALHQGHISLIKEARDTTNIVICSVFVNPTQFNDTADLIKYPRTEKEDIELLRVNNCDAVFIPNESDIYPNKKNDYSIDLNGLDEVMEGKFRDNHFEGVCMVVEKFFNLVRPDFAFFGNKDFQQVSIIRHMVSVRNLPVKIVSCPILREKSGLALSSRNARLSISEKKDAIVISQALFAGVNAYNLGNDLRKVKSKVLSILDSGKLRLEYLEIVDDKTLKAVDSIHSNCTVCIAAYCGSVRLIDNCQF